MAYMGGRRRISQSNKIITLNEHVSGSTHPVHMDALFYKDKNTRLLVLVVYVAYTGRWDAPPSHSKPERLLITC